jgi:hypothetical protein
VFKLAIISKTAQSPDNEKTECSNVYFICPVCKKKKELKIPNSVINEARQLTTVSIPKGLVCSHHFQAFVDKNLAVRGYQRVDFELAYDILNKNKDINKPNENKKEHKKFYENLIIEGNFIEFKPDGNPDLTKYEEMKSKLYVKEEIISNSKPNKQKKKSVNSRKSREMTLEEIYDEFWEIIDDENEDFKHLIEIDNRRKNK